MLSPLYFYMFFYLAFFVFYFRKFNIIKNKKLLATEEYYRQNEYESKNSKKKVFIC